MDSITNVVQKSPSLKQVRIFYCVKQRLVAHTIPRSSYIRRILAAPPLSDQCPRSRRILCAPKLYSPHSHCVGLNGNGPHKPLGCVTA